MLIVINKAQAHAFDLNRRGLKEKFPAIRDFLQTDCEAEHGLEELRHAILRETDQLEHLRDPFPASWFSVKDTLAHLREREGENFIPFARYQQLCAEQGVTETVSQETLVGFLHDLGIVVNFRDDPRLTPMNHHPDEVSQARVWTVQGQLFPLSPRAVCDEIRLNWWAAEQLHADGWLSFDPAVVAELDEAQEAELRFVGALVVARCDARMLERLLAPLTKPYCCLLKKPP